MDLAVFTTPFKVTLTSFIFVFAIDEPTGIEMAHKVRYKFNGVAKEINFSYSRHQNMHEAVADAEGVDLTHFLQTEQQVASISKGKATVRNFRDSEFVKMGFTELYFLKNGQE